MRNLKYMAKFAAAYPNDENDEFVQQPVAQIPWGHNITLLDKLSDNKERLWYAEKIAENGWSRNVLVHQIESGLYQRQGRWGGQCSTYRLKAAFTNAAFSRYTSNSYKAIDRPLG